MDILIAQAMLPPGAPLDVGPADLVPPAILAPDAAATTRFSEMMAAPVDGAVPAQAAPVTGAIDQAYPPVPAAGGTIGDSVLNGLRNMSSDFQQSWQKVHAALDTPNVTITELLKLQMGLTQMSIQYDMVGKAISRSTQNLDQLVKLQ